MCIYSYSIPALERRQAPLIAESPIPTQYNPTYFFLN